MYTLATCPASVSICKSTSFCASKDSSDILLSSHCQQLVYATDNLLASICCVAILASVLRTCNSQADELSAWEMLADMLMDVCLANPEATAHLSQTMHAAIASEASPRQPSRGWSFRKLLAPISTVATFGMRALYSSWDQSTGSKLEEPDAIDLVPRQDGSLSPKHRSPASDEGQDFASCLDQEQSGSPGADVTSADHSVYSSAPSSLSQTPQQSPKELQTTPVHLHANCSGKWLSVQHNSNIFSHCCSASHKFTSRSC